jgi:nitroimidazol reductase NimA-like FMN-containing flavoprotein (pyridoxamine 5'-phosphate oxidase superfamily)
MRRADKEITDRNIIDSVLRKSLVCRIAMYDGEMPYVVPLSFGYDGKNIYLHSAKDGRKIDILKRNPNLCFEFETECEVLPAERACSFTMRYRSVIGYGNACFLEDSEEKIAAMRIIMRHYTDKTFAFTEKDVENIAVIRIDIKEITGKQSGFNRDV